MNDFYYGVSEITPFEVTVTKDHVTMKRNIHIVEDYRSWEQRMYDEYEDYFLFGIGEAPPRRQEIVSEDMVTMHFEAGKVKLVDITNSIGTYKIEYDNNGFTATINGNDAGASLKEVMIRQDGNGNLIYYGVTLQWLGWLPDNEIDKRRSEEDVVFGLWGIPLIIANKNEEDDYINVRMYDNVADQLFHLAMPFELQPDLPNDMHFNGLWVDAMRHLIAHPADYPEGLSAYLRRFFGKVGSIDNVTYYISGKSLSLLIGRYDGTGDEFYRYYDIVHNGKVYAMHDMHRNITVFLRDNRGYNRAGYSRALLSDRNVQVNVYVGKGMFHLVIMNATGCQMTVELLSSGYQCLINDRVQPIWDAFGIMRDEDILTYNSIKSMLID